MNSCPWCVEHNRTHEQRHNRVQRYVFIAPYSRAVVYVCPCAGKKRTPICNEGVAPFSEICKDRDIKLYPVALRFASCNTYTPIHLAHMVTSQKARRCWSNEIESTWLRCMNIPLESHRLRKYDNSGTARL